MMFICDISIFNRYGKLQLDKILKPLGIDWRELVVMLVLERVPKMPQGRLIPFLQTDKANVTKLLQNAENKGLIRRVPDVQDRRNNLCHLTDTGKAMLPRLHDVLKDWESACFAGLDEAQAAQFRDTAKIIVNNLIKE